MTGFARRWWSAPLALAALALALRGGIATRSLGQLDRLYVPDDTYYTLSIARSLAAGLGPTADGVTLTSGFQPLLAFLLVPFFWATRDPDVPLRAALVLGAVADSASVLLLWALARRMSPAHGHVAAVVVAILWALSPLAVANALGGLETSLSLSLSLGLVLAWIRARERYSAASFVGVGALVGLGLLARVDAVFLVALLGVGELWFGRRAAVAWASLTAAAVVAPWWVYSAVRFGSIVPESGAAVRGQVAVHQELYLTPFKQMGWAAGSVIGAPSLDLPGVRAALLRWDGAGGAAFVIVTVAAVLWRVRAHRRSAPLVVRWPLEALVVSALAMLGFYAFAVPALWFFKRYLVTAHAVSALALADAAGCLVVARPSRGFVRNVSRLALGAILAVAVAGSAQTLARAVAHPAGTYDEGLDGAKGYGAPAKQVLQSLPRDAVLGALQSGALSYYAPVLRPDVRVVNLDGVVDGAAARAFRDQTLADYALARGVNRVADWPFNLKAFAMASRRSTARPRLDPESLASMQGEADGFVVCRVVW